MPDAGTYLALTRTFAALDRTLMAWIRTSTSLISFGFSIYKFFETFRESISVRQNQLMGARGFAITMMSIGLAALLVSTFSYRREKHELATRYAEYAPFPQSFSVAIASSIIALGILGLVLVLLRQ